MIWRALIWMRNPLDTDEIKPIVEAMLFATAEPLKAERIAVALEVEKPLVQQVLSELVEEYGQSGRGFLLAEVADGFQFRTRPEHGEWLRRLKQSRPFRFSRAALETLAIVAYRQPITRAEVDFLRGVDSGGVIRSLAEKNLVRVLGKKDIMGKPLIYGTTGEFLELFGLRNLSELPTLKEISELPLDLVEEEAFGNLELPLLGEAERDVS